MKPRMRMWAGIIFIGFLIWGIYALSKSNTPPIDDPVDPRSTTEEL